MPLVSAPLVLSQQAGAEAVRIEAKTIEFDASNPARRVAGGLEYLSGFELDSASPRWGAFSSAVVDAEGDTLIAVSDRGMWLRLRLRHAADGRLVGVDADADLLPLLDRSGLPLRTPAAVDAEAVARAPDGSLLVAFQDDDRLWRYGPAGDPLTSAAQPVRGPRGLRAADKDEGVSAMSALPDGRLLILAESRFSQMGDVRGWLRRDDRWSEIGWLPVGSYQPTDMVALPDGNVLLLSRRYSVYDGFAARLSIIESSRIIPLARLQDREVAVLVAPLAADNFESVAARQGPDGSVLLYLLSDDRRRAVQRTLLLQFRLLDSVSQPPSNAMNPG
jgi:hypothetical protein